MGFTSIWHWIIVLLIVVLLFGAGKLPKVMGDLAKGIKNFKAGLKDDSDDEAPAQPAATVTPLPNQAAAPVVPPAPAAAPGTDPGLKKDETART
ncbi:twin-arginine translocase TatA/TatE family subunit [Azospirillum sp. TSO22-1]|uniref:twin-arginine translocase TatA/TatE family subunit n=1 Tax=Azospirillum sp. TSO22-1 TaxID=716789 RepID=UPI000D60FA44|nr:twin-arginine translocase TatA/TatE family subunit [Azospirillum sp. TSO22-1]PWC52779.1 hypothetical protein TSO221_12830 [Azospirillum sp. TSO22-1]